MLFSVLPMAVEADLLIAFRIIPDSSTIKIANVLPKFPAGEFDVPEAGKGELEIDQARHEWTNYFKSGYRGAVEFLRRNGVDKAMKPPGLEVLIDGNLPAGGGLSSSAAFVCASAIATMASMGVQMVDKKELVSLAIVSERYVGVNAGGMDQSASVLGEAGSALYISFDPELEAELVAFPKTGPEAVFLIANTYKTANKVETGPVDYNLRVVETTLAAEVLARKLQLGALPEDGGPLGSTLKGVFDAYCAKTPSARPLDQRLEDLACVAEQALFHKEGGYTREEIAGVLGIEVDALVARYMTKFPVRAERFQLQTRTLHVLRD